MKMEDVDFLVHRTNTYSKEFGNQKAQLKEKGYEKEATAQFLREHIKTENLSALAASLRSNTLLASVPTAKRAGAVNAIPKAYASYIGKETKSHVLDLNDFMEYEKQQSSRSSYTAASMAKNAFSFKFLDNRKLALFKQITKGKEVIIVDDVITTGETMVHLGTYLKQKVPELNLRGGTSLVSNSIRKPTLRDVMRFSEKLAKLTNHQFPLVELHRIVGEQFGPYTRLKMARFERGVKDPASAFKAIETIKLDNERVQFHLRKSIDFKEPFPNNRNDMER